jgi:streptogramin lyase
VDVGFTPLGIAFKGTVQFSTAPNLDQVRALDTKTGDRFAPIQFDANSKPTGIALGQDGNLWVTLNGTGYVARINAQTLATTKWSVGAEPYAIAAAPNGDLWFTLQGQDKVGKITSGGSVTTYDASSGSTPAGLTVDSSGTVWFTERDGSQVGRIKGGVVEEWKCVHGNARPEEIVVSPAGRVYYNDRENAVVVAFTANTLVAGHEPLDTDQVQALRQAEFLARTEGRGSRGPGVSPPTEPNDPSLESVSVSQGVAVFRGNINGAVGYNMDPQGGPAGIAMAQDGTGDVWLTQKGVGKVTRLSSSGSTYTYVLPSSQSFPSGIVVTPTNDVWVTMPGTGQMAQIPSALPITVTISGNGSTREPKRALKSQSISFTASVSGATNTAVTWELLEGSPSAGTITSSGNYTAPGIPGIYHVIARSQQDPSKYGRMEIIVYPFTRWPTGSAVVLAGNVDGSGNVDGTGTAARFFEPTGIAVDGSGNFYVADSQNHTVRKISSAGVVSTLAGSPGLPGSVDGTGSSAHFYKPTAIAVDDAGNIFVTDCANHTIRKITQGGTVSTYAGSAGKPGNADGNRSSARFNWPAGITVNSSGTVYVSDTENHTIRAITTSGVVSTLAGLAGNAGSVDGTGNSARFWLPKGMDVDAGGNIFVADMQNHTIRRITSAGAVSTWAGIAGVPSAVDGPVPSATFQYPIGVSVSSTGYVYVADAGNWKIRLITPAPGRSVGTWLDGYNRSAGSQVQPLGLVLSGTGVYVADQSHSAIWKVTVNPAIPLLKIVETFAGATSVWDFVNGTGSAALFHEPIGVAVDSNNYCYVADRQNSAIRRISPAGVVNTFAGGTFGWADGTGTSARFRWPWGLTCVHLLSDVLFVADTENSVIRMIGQAGTTGSVTTPAGAALQDGYVNGTGSAVRFNDPRGVAADTSFLYIADTLNNVIRRGSTTGAVTTLAGGYPRPRDGVGTDAGFHHPIDLIAVPGNRSVYVLEEGYNTIRTVTNLGVVDTWIGGSWSWPAGFTDGPLSAARLNKPTGIARDDNGRIYIADSRNNAIRVITSSFVATLFGDRTLGISRPGLLRDATDAPLGSAYGGIANPSRIDVNSSGTALYVTTNNGVMKISITW